MLSARRLDKYFRVGFVLYGLLIVTLTHWPQLRVESGIPRTDLWAHLLAFFCWTILLLATGWIAPRRDWKNLALGVPTAIAYAGLDELTQGIPGLGRYVTWADFAANCVGVGIAAAVWAGALVWSRRGGKDSEGGPSASDGSNASVT